MTMTKVQKQQKMRSERKRSILIYAIGIMSCISVANNYFQAKDIADLQTQVYVLELNAINAHQQNFATTDEVNAALGSVTGKVNEALGEVSKAFTLRDIQIELVIDAIGDLQENHKKEEPINKPPAI